MRKVISEKDHPCVRPPFEFDDATIDLPANERKKDGERKLKI